VSKRNAERNIQGKRGEDWKQNEKKDLQCGQFLKEISNQNTKGQPRGRGRDELTKSAPFKKKKKKKGTETRQKADGKGWRSKGSELRLREVLDMKKTWEEEENLQKGCRTARM